MGRSKKAPIALGDTKNLSNDEWANGWRQHGPAYKDPFDPAYIPVCIGGSAVAAIFGDSPWMSRLELYHLKSGTAIPKVKKPKNEEILQSGHQLEEFVAQKFCEFMKIHGNQVEIWNDTQMYQHPDYPFAVCNLDRRIKVNGIPGILECKTTSNFSDIELWKAGICPVKYEWQCRYYMATMDLDYVYICCCWGFTLDQTAVILIKRDRAIEDVMMSEVANFVECCEMGIEPVMQTTHMDTLSAYYTALYGEIPTKAPAIELPDTTDIYELVERARTISNRRKQAEEKVNKIKEEEAEITAKLLAISEGKSTYYTYRLDDDTVVGIKIKQSKKRDSYDEATLIAENPDILQKYPKVDMTRAKKAYPEICKKYLIPGTVDTTKAAVIDSVELKNIPISV